MSVTHHPDEALLLAYAAGTTGEALALIVATHLSFCVSCRRTVALAERIGGELLEELPPVPLAPEALNTALSRLEGAVPFAAPVVAPSRDATPAPLRAVLGGDLSTVRWRRMGPRLAYRPLFRRGATSVKLLRGVEGADVGNHTHRGMEYTLVLAGGFTDETGSYGPGDLQVADSTLRHNPKADPGETCVNLAVTTAPLRFESLLQRIASPLFGF